MCKMTDIRTGKVYEPGKLERLGFTPVGKVRFSVSDCLIERFGEEAIKYQRGDETCLAVDIVEGFLTVIARYNPKTMKGAELFL